MADAVLTKIAEISVTQQAEAAEIVALQRTWRDQHDDLCNYRLRFFLPL
jgi:hypothetical protein